MTYVINNYDGTVLTSVPDRAVDVTATSLSLPGRNYKPYGETLVENLVYLLQNFAQGVPPQNPVNGQIWYDTSTKQVKVYDVSVLDWLTTSTPLFGSSLPVSGTTAQIFYDTNKKQLFVYDAQLPTMSKWRLIGPVGAHDNSDPVNPTIPGHSTWEVVRIPDLSLTPQTRTIWRLVNQGVLVCIWATDTFNLGIPGFSDPIRPGINLPVNHVLSGTSARSQLSDNSLALGGLPVSTYMRTDISNQPDTDAARSLGAQSARYASVHAVSFVGTATQAQSATNATNAVNAQTAVSATNSTQLAGQPASFYRNVSNLNAGTLDVARLPYAPVNKAGDTLTGPLALAADPLTNLQAATKQYVDTQIVANTLAVYVSGLFNISNSGVFPLSHGLAQVPQFVTVTLVNQISDAGYNPGDQIEITPGSHPANVGFSVKKTTTQLLIYVGSSGVAHVIQADGTGTSVTLTTASWRMQVRAWS